MPWHQLDRLQQAAHRPGLAGTGLPEYRQVAVEQQGRIGKHTQFRTLAEATYVQAVASNRIEHCFELVALGHTGRLERVARIGRLRERTDRQR